MENNHQSMSSQDETVKKYMEKLDRILSEEELWEEAPGIECELCSKVFPSVEMYQLHLNSKGHYKMILKIKSTPNTSDDDDDDTSNEELHCDICNKSALGYKNFIVHLRGKVHSKNLKQQKLKEKNQGMDKFDQDSINEIEDDTLLKPFARCLTCGITLKGPESYQQHMEGASHKKKLHQMKIIKSLEENEDAAIENDMEIHGFYRCKVCCKSFTGPVPYEMHMTSPIHKKKLRQAQAEEELKDFFPKKTDKLMCKECKTLYPDPFSFKTHLLDNSHSKQKVKDIIFNFVFLNPEIVAVKSVQNISDDEEEEDADEQETFKTGKYFLVCKLCCKSFSGPENAQDHVDSIKHMKKKMEKAEMKALKDKLKEKQSEVDNKPNS